MPRKPKPVPVCATYKCGRTDIKGRGLCRACYRRAWRKSHGLSRQRRRRTDQTAAECEEECRTRKISFLEVAYLQATTVTAALRMRDYLEKTRREAAN